MRVLCKDGRMRDLEEVNRGNYAVPANEMHVVHVKLTSVDTDSFGDKVRSCTLQKFGFKEYDSIKRQLQMNHGYVLEVLHSPVSVTAETKTDERKIEVETVSAEEATEIKKKRTYNRKGKR